MLRHSNILRVLLISLVILFSTAYADNTVLGEQTNFYLDKTLLVQQQIGLLKKRQAQATQEFSYLQHNHEKGFVSLVDDQANKFLLFKLGLHIASTKSSLDSINIELTDSQQAMSGLEKNIQEIENQLNALNIFGVKLIHADATQVQGLRSELKYQVQLLELEKTRADYLAQLQRTESAALQLDYERHAQVNGLLKSRKMLHFKEQQVKSEIEFQQQQNYWLQQLDSLYGQLKSGDARVSIGSYGQLEGEIFNANENINLVYLKTLVARYHDQIRQMRLSISRTNSISVLNSLSDQVQTLAKQILRVNVLINARIEIVKKRNVLTDRERQNKVLNQLSVMPINNPTIDQFRTLDVAYLNLHNDVVHLNKRLMDFRTVLEKSIQQELSARQGLPGFSSNAWLDLGKEVVLLPNLSFRLIKGFTLSFVKAIQGMSAIQWILFILMEAIFVVLFASVKKILLALSAKQWISTFLLRNFKPVVVIANMGILFCFLAIPTQQFGWVIDLALVWLFFKMVMFVARRGLVETVHHSMGLDVQLYKRLKAVLSFSAVVTTITVFLHQLPLIFEIKDLFDRLFLLSLLAVSVLVLRSWRVVPQLILQYVDNARTYLRRIIYFLGIFIPALLFINSLIGLFGFVNLVGMISWYEGVFTAVLIAYFILRGLLSDGMEAISNLLIGRVSNGWLWREAFLKPLHSVLRVMLFFGGWTLLFLFYGWDQQSPVVERLNKLLMYPIVSVLNTTITLVSICELIFAISLFYWAARWTREFVFRMLLSKTRDLGIRNSIAILTQYAVVILGALLCLRLLGIDLHALFLVVSGLLIAISFGLKDLVNNFACGLLLLFERPIRVGDIVSVNNQEGKVTHIGSRAVTIRTWDHMDVLVPNTEIFNKAFVNWTVKDDIVRSVILITIDREDDPNIVQQVIHDVLKAHQDVLLDPPAEVFMKDMVENTSEFEVRYYINVRQVVSRVGVRSEVLFAIWKAFADHGIKAPNSQHEIMIKGHQQALTTS